MPTVFVNLDESQYVQVNTGLNSIMLQSLRDEVRIAVNPTKPAANNNVFHTLSGKDAPIVFTPDTNIWALAMTNRSALIASENDLLPTADMGVSVARGKIPGATPFGSYGKRTAAGAETNRVIWPDGIFSIPDQAGVQMSIVSTSVNDSAAGTSIQKIELHYLDINLAEQHETVIMNGTTPVLTVATDIRFINCMHVHEYGSNGPYAAGDITASNGGTTYSIISTGELRCSSSARMIPGGKVCYVAGAVGGAVSGTAAAGVFMQIVATELDANQYVEPMILFPHGGIGMQDTSISYNFPVPLKFSAGTVVALSMTTDKAAVVGGSWFGWLEDTA